MYDEVIKKILESIDESKILTEAYPRFSGEGYRAHKIDIKNFHEIKKTVTNKKIAFVSLLKALFGGMDKKRAYIALSPVGLDALLPISLGEKAELRNYSQEKNNVILVNKREV